MPACDTLGMRRTAYQYDKKIEADDGEPKDLDPPRHYLVEPITPEEADAFIRKYEYLGTTGHPRARYGARDWMTGKLAAVATFGQPAFTPQPGVIVLERGACAPWAHEHTASYFIPRAVRRAAQDHGWHTFIAYADPEAGEWGTVYQSCNWMYVGQSATRRLGGRARPREYFRKGDKLISEHAFRARGLTIADVHSGEWERIFVPAKFKYVWIEGTWRNGRGPSRSEIKRLRAAYTPRPYPVSDFVRLDPYHEED